MESSTHNSSIKLPSSLSRVGFRSRLRVFIALYQRELVAYLMAPLSSVFLVVFLGTIGAFTVYIGLLFEREIADLLPLFQFMPWFLMLFCPAITMRSWAEEQKSGTIEFLLTLPASPTQIVLAKFFGCCKLTGIAVCATFPMWIAVSILGNPDHGVILASYVGAILLAGAYVGIGGIASMLTRSQTTAFVLGVFGNFVMTMTGSMIFLSLFQGWAPNALLVALSDVSLLYHMNEISKGVLGLRNVSMFLLVITISLIIQVWLAARRLMR